MARPSSLSRKIVKLELPDEVADRLRASIVLGELPPGFRLVERDMAARLGVSRTPVRQAFFALQDEGLVSSCEGRGLVVSELNADEISDIYQIIAALERAALLTTPAVSDAMLADLAAANRRLASAGHNLSQIIRADAAWHRALTRFSTNQALKSLLELWRIRSERYERAFFQADRNLARAVADHSRVEAVLRRGDFAKVADAIEAHWLDAIAPMRAAIGVERGV
jgi:GntR family transcriptional regulator, rspAB operon transcriptional repressor